jgi:hypothetical protein
MTHDDSRAESSVTTRAAVNAPASAAGYHRQPTHVQDARHKNPLLTACELAPRMLAGQGNQQLASQLINQVAR